MKAFLSNNSNRVLRERWDIFGRAAEREARYLLEATHESYDLVCPLPMQESLSRKLLGKILADAISVWLKED